MYCSSRGLGSNKLGQQRMQRGIDPIYWCLGGATPQDPPFTQLNKIKKIKKLKKSKIYTNQQNQKKKIKNF